MAPAGVAFEVVRAWGLIAEDASDGRNGGEELRRLALTSSVISLTPPLHRY